MSEYIFNISLQVHEFAHSKKEAENIIRERLHSMGKLIALEEIPKENLSVTVNERGEKRYYVPTCPVGATDCVHDPEYIKYTDSIVWEDLGCPKECKHQCITSKDKDYCYNYEQKE